MQSLHLNQVFVERVQLYTDILKNWCKHELHADFSEYIYNLLEHHAHKFKLEWPVNDILQLGFAQMAISQYSIEQLNELHAYDIFCQSVTSAADNIWRYYLEMAYTTEGICLDQLISERLFSAPGKGISYLCLRVAAEVPITEILEEEIAISEKLCPKLPFDSNAQSRLLKIVGSKKRLRLAMCMAQILGRSCNKLKVSLEAEHFKVNWLNLLRELTTIEDSEVVFEELNVIIECLRCSCKTSGEVQELPPSPIQHKENA